MPIAQFRYDPATELWALFWCNRNGRWFAYGEIDPTPDINILIDEVDKDPTHIFWG